MTTPRATAICFICERYEPGTDPDNDLNIPRCRAFPEGIPSEIINGGFDHREPFGDETLLFLLAEGKTEEDIEEWEQEMLELKKMEMTSAIRGFQEPPA
jgi:hypothetical protein